MSCLSVPRPAFAEHFQAGVKTINAATANHELARQDAAMESMKILHRQIT